MREGTRAKCGSNTGARAAHSARRGCDGWRRRSAALQAITSAPHSSFGQAGASPSSAASRRAIHASIGGSSVSSK
jgi:hypothetical protein